MTTEYGAYGSKEMVVFEKPSAIFENLAGRARARECRKTPFALPLRTDQPNVLKILLLRARLQSF